MPPALTHPRPIGTLGRTAPSRLPVFCVALILGAVLGAMAATAFFTHHNAASGIHFEPAAPAVHVENSQLRLPEQSQPEVGLLF